MAGEQTSGTDVPDDDLTDEPDEVEPKDVETAKTQLKKMAAINKELISSRDKAKRALRLIEKEKEDEAAKKLTDQKKFEDLYTAEQKKTLALQDKYLQQAISIAVNAELTKMVLRQQVPLPNL